MDKVSAFHPHVDQETADVRAQAIASAKGSAHGATTAAKEGTVPGDPRKAKVRPVDRFKRLLLGSYGNYVRAWREGLDFDKNGRLDFEEFRRCCSDIGYPGPRREVWEQLDVNDTGEVTLGEIDEPTAVMLESFYSCVMERYVSWDEAWSTHFD